MFWWIKRKIHISWLVMIFCLAFSAGVWLTLYINHKFSFWVAIIAVILVIVCLFFRRAYLISVLIISSLFIGFCYGSFKRSDVNNMRDLVSQSVIIKGAIDGDVKYGLYGKESFTLSGLSIGDKNYDTSVWASVSYDGELERGDTIVVSGKISDGFGNFSGSIYSANILSVVKTSKNQIGNIVRNWFSNNISKVIDQPGASLGLGFLLGEQRGISHSFSLALVAVGLTHAIVASGYNLTILVRLSRKIFFKISKYMAVFASICLVGMFVLITGFGPSMVRAGIVTFLSLITWYYGRNFHPLVLISIAVFLTLVYDPSFIWGDVGWQLSFLAFFGVMVFAPLIKSFFFGEEKTGFISQIIIETIAAQILTLPIIILYFGQFSNISLIANLIIVPLIPLAMLLTFVAGLSAVFSPFLASIISWPANLLLNSMVVVINKLADVSWAVTKVNFSIKNCLVAYGLIGITIIVLKLITRHKFTSDNLVK